MTRLSDTKKISLRPLEESDSGLIYGWHNNPAVTKYSMNSLVIPSSLADVKNFINTAIVPGKIITYGISVKKKLVGYIGISNINSVNRSGEYFVFIGSEDNWGKGYGYSSSKMIIKYAFESLNLNRLELTVSELNTRGVNLYKKLGFIQEGLKREATFREGKYHGKLVMSMLRKEYEKK